MKLSGLSKQRQGSNLTSRDSGVEVERSPQKLVRQWNRLKMESRKRIRS